MSFFQRYNSRPVPKKFDYKPNSALKQFKAMKIHEVKDTTTSLGETARLDCVASDGEYVRFFLVKEDYDYFGAGACDELNSEVRMGRHPIAVSCKTKVGLRTAILSSSK